VGGSAVDAGGRQRCLVAEQDPLLRLLALALANADNGGRHVTGNRAVFATLPVALESPAMVAVSDERASILLTQHLGSAQVCQEPPSTGAGVCGFRF